MQPKNPSQAPTNTVELQELAPKVTLTCKVKDHVGQVLESITDVTILDEEVSSLFSKPYHYADNRFLDGEFTVGGETYMFEVNGITFSKIFSRIKKLGTLRIELEKQKKLHNDATRKVSVVRSMYQNNPNAHEKEMTAALMNEQTTLRSLSLAQAFLDDCEKFLEEYKV